MPIDKSHNSQRGNHRGTRNHEAAWALSTLLYGFDSNDYLNSVKGQHERQTNIFMQAGNEFNRTESATMRDSWWWTSYTNMTDRKEFLMLNSCFIIQQQFKIHMQHDRLQLLRMFYLDPSFYMNSQNNCVYSVFIISPNCHTVNIFFDNVNLLKFKTWHSGCKWHNRQANNETN